MLARLQSASLRGLDAEAVDVEVDLSRGLPCWTLVGRIKLMSGNSLKTGELFGSTLLKGSVPFDSGAPC
ncbi:hypothetical protein JYT48_00115 [Mariprofundus ferrooxydans]|nr:hypothetical protein [Mariprofundus ferrooxydans]